MFNKIVGRRSNREAFNKIAVKNSQKIPVSEFNFSKIAGFWLTSLPKLNSFTGIFHRFGTHAAVYFVD